MRLAYLLLAAAMAVGAAVGFSVSAQAIPLSGTVTYYSDFSENLGVGITFSNSTGSQSFTYISDTASYGGTNSQSMWPGGSILFGADFLGTITAPSAGDYRFSFGVDDAAYVFVNGSSTPNAWIGGGNDLCCSGAPRIITLALNAGSNPFELQYANEYCCQTAIVFTSVPELSIWAMMAVGFAGLGFAGYRGSRKSAALAA